MALQLQNSQKENKKRKFLKKKQAIAILQNRIELYGKKLK